jgi:cytochrome c-type biogenesis protein CcmH
MTQFLLLGTLLTAVAMAFVFWPFRRQATLLDPTLRRQDNLAVYRQRVAELDRDRRDGNLDAEDLDSLVEELSATLLDDVPEDAEGETARAAVQASLERPNQTWLMPAALASLVAMFALVVYVELGAGAAMELAGASELLNSKVDRPIALAELIVQLQRRIDAHPDDVDSLYLLGRARMRERNYAAAASSFDRAVAINRFDPSLLVAQIQAHFMVDGRRVSEANRAHAERLLAVSPDQPQVLEILAIDATAVADYVSAAGYLERALGRASTATQTARLRSELDRVRGLAGISAGPAIDVTVTGLAGIDGLTPQAVVYFIARRSGERMPRMVLRRGVGEDPLTVRLDGAALMGEQDPLREGETLEVIARLSPTGDVRPGPDTVDAISPAVTLGKDPVVVRLEFGTGAEPGRSDQVAKTEAAATKPVATGAMVTIEVAAAEGLQADPQTRVFVIVRPLSGPPMPVAVRALSFADLPAVVQLSDADAMQPGRTLSRFEEVSVLARLSRSGSPTSQPGDVESEIVKVRPLDRPAVSLLLN